MFGKRECSEASLLENLETNLDGELIVRTEEEDNLSSYDINDFIQSVKLECWIKAYAPSAFQIIRKADHVNKEDMIKSLMPSMNREQIFKSNQNTAGVGSRINGGGSSGSFFFFTQDNKYVVKTVNDTEIKKILAVLPALIQYYEQNEQNNQQTRLASLYGLYEVKLQGHNSTKFMIMKNELNLISEDNEIILKFDLKGSQVNRSAFQKGDVMQNFKLMKSVTMKDNDFTVLRQHKNLINIGSRDRHHLMQIIKADVKFLASQNIMDYSLFIGIELVSDA